MFRVYSWVSSLFPTQTSPKDIDKGLSSDNTNFYVRFSQREPTVLLHLSKPTFSEFLGSPLSRQGILSW